MKRILCTLVGLAIAGSSVGFADEKGDKGEKGEKKAPDRAKMFERIDKDKDGKLTLAEFTGKRTGEKKEKAEKAFARMDKDGDESVSKEEFMAPRGKKKK